MGIKHQLCSTITPRRHPGRRGLSAFSMTTKYQHRFRNRRGHQELHGSSHRSPRPFGSAGRKLISFSKGREPRRTAPSHPIRPASARWSFFGAGKLGLCRLYGRVGQYSTPTGAWSLSGCVGPKESLRIAGRFSTIHDSVKIVAQVVIGHTCRSFVFVIMAQCR
jgi:hypothetical protein